MKMKKNHRNLEIDLAIIILSIVASVILVNTGTAASIITFFKYPILECFIAGMFFTSAATTPLAIVFLAYLAPSLPLTVFAIAGGTGAVIGDLIIFRFIRDKFSKDLTVFLKEKKYGNHFRLLYHLKMFRYMTFLLGGMIIASPFPDELGIALLGFSKIKTAPFVILSFIFNSIGIATIGYVALSI
ncbi:MAG: hypothetical protein EXS59_00060 [Candidatus Taylorbacteria bacterium]|nr:hypothetical protein [Candidatus Taylorbacteria bacterium]